MWVSLLSLVAQKHVSDKNPKNNKNIFVLISVHFLFKFDYWHRFDIDTENNSSWYYFDRFNNSLIYFSKVNPPFIQD